MGIYRFLAFILCIFFLTGCQSGQQGDADNFSLYGGQSIAIGKGQISDVSGYVDYSWSLYIEERNPLYFFVARNRSGAYQVACNMDDCSDMDLFTAHSMCEVKTNSTCELYALGRIVVWEGYRIKKLSLNSAFWESSIGTKFRAKSNIHLQSTDNWRVNQEFRFKLNWEGQKEEVDFRIRFKDAWTGIIYDSGTDHPSCNGTFKLSSKGLKNQHGDWNLLCADGRMAKGKIGLHNATYKTDKRNISLSGKDQDENRVTFFYIP